MMEKRKGKVAAPKPSPYIFRELFEKNVQAKFVGVDVSMKDLTSPEGKAKIEEARKETEEALGYTREEAENRNELESIYNHLQYSKKEKGEQELEAVEPESVM